MPTKGHGGKRLRKADVDVIATLLDAAIDRDQMIVSELDLLDFPGRLVESSDLAKINNRAIENAQMLQAVWSWVKAKEIPAAVTAPGIATIVFASQKGSATSTTPHRLDLLLEVFPKK